MQVYLYAHMHICAFPACKKLFMNSWMPTTISSRKSWIKIVYATLFHLLVNNYCIVIYLSLPYATYTNSTQNAKQHPVVQKDIVCGSCLIHISENWSSWRQEGQGFLLSLGRWMLWVYTQKYIGKYQYTPGYTHKSILWLLHHLN